MEASAIANALTLAVEHHRAGRDEDAELLLRQILRAEPTHAEALRCLDLVTHSAATLEGFQSALGINPQFAEVHFQNALRLQQDGQHATAVALFRLAVHLVPDHASAYRHMAESLRTLGHEEEAQEAWRTAAQFEAEEPSRPPPVIAPLSNLTRLPTANPDQGAGGR